MSKRYPTGLEGWPWWKVAGLYLLWPIAWAADKADRIIAHIRRRRRSDE